MTRCTCHSHSGFLTAAGLAAVAQRTSLEGLAPRGELEYVDKVVSVSASTGPSVHWPGDPVIESTDEQASRPMRHPWPDAEWP